MKTILAGVSILALAMAVPAFAQDNSSTVTQTGTGNTANVTQGIGMLPPILTPPPL